MQQIYNQLADVANFLSLSLLLQMLPDYPHKIFSDKRSSYTLLMLALAMDELNS